MFSEMFEKSAEMSVDSREIRNNAMLWVRNASNSEVNINITNLIETVYDVCIVSTN